MKIYGYARVSTAAQNEDRQIISLLEAGVPEGNIYVDKQSGKDFDRGQYKRLIKKLDKGSVLFIKSLDRFGRDYEDIMEQWRVIVKEKEADIVILDMPLLDTRSEKNLLGTLISDIVLALFSYVSQNERESIRLRQSEGIAIAKMKGVKFGRPSRDLPMDFVNTVKRYRRHEITAKEAGRITGLSAANFVYHANRRYPLIEKDE